MSLNWLLVLAISLTISVGCRRKPPTEPPNAPKIAPIESSSQQAWLRDVTTDSGVAFQHQIGDFAKYEMPSIMGSGCALVDFDVDGRLDLYFVNGQTENKKSSQLPEPDRGDSFYRQATTGQFVEILKQTGLTVSEFGMGAWWGDMDADGFPDLFLSNVGANRLFHNLGDGTFQEVSLPPGVVEDAWSTASCWADLNGDGHLDLFVVNYVDYIPGQYCEGPDGLREFCGPSTYPGTVDRILINQGSWETDNGSLFADETVQRGLGNQTGRGLGTIAQDFNADRKIDLYVTNDQEPNHLWIQQPDGTFQEQADLLGVARNFLGETEASMGIVTHDWNEDGSPDLLISHLSGETNTLYLSDSASGSWVDATARSGLGPKSLSRTGFSIGLFDIEHDGDSDLLIANGGVKRDSSNIETTDLHAPYVQRNSLFLRSDDSFSFTERSEIGGTFSSEQKISRAMVVGDLDQDGDCDIALSNCSGEARIYENVAPKHGHSLILILVDTIGNRTALGASVSVKLQEGLQVVQAVNPYQGYLSQNDTSLHFGLGDVHSYQSIEVTWSDGTLESYPGGKADRQLILVRGQNELQETDFH